MSDNQHTESLRKLSKFLIQGAEMLKESCPSCNVPLLKDKKTNKIFCGSCQREVVYANESNASDIEYEITAKIEAKNLKNNLEIFLIGKLNNITNNIPQLSGNDLLNQLVIIEKILDILSKLNNLSK